jgi:nitrogen regulatory protein P-II 1
MSVFGMGERYRLASVWEVRYGAAFAVPRMAPRKRHRGLRGSPWGLFLWSGKESSMTKVEAIVIRDRVETVIDAVEDQTGHVGVTVVEAIGHGRQRGITHEYRGRIFESRFLPKAVLTFVVDDDIAEAVVAAIADAARSGNESGDGIAWTSSVQNVTHNRTGQPLEEVEIG